MPNSEDIQGMRFEAMFIRNRTPVTFSLLPETVEEVASLLDLSGDRANLGYRLSFIARNYLTSEDIDRTYLSLADGHRELRRIAISLKKILAGTHALHPMQLLLLDYLLPPSPTEPSRKRSLIGIEAALRDLATAAESAQAAFKPRRGPKGNESLRLSVGALMLLFEKLTGVRATVSLTDDGEWSPRLSSPQAQAIALIMQAADPDLGEVTIVDAIHHISKQHRQKSLSIYEPLVRMSASKLTAVPY